MKAAVNIYPRFINPEFFLYRLEPDVDCPYTLLRAFLEQFSPVTGELKQEPLAGVSLQAIKSKHVNKAFFAEFNAVIGIDYLLAFKATQDKKQPEIEYLKRSLTYLYKAMRENNQEAEYWLTELLFDLAKYQKELNDRELDLWIDERFWHLQALLSDKSSETLKRQVERYYQSLQTAEESSVVGKNLRRRSISSPTVITHERAFSPALLRDPHIRPSIRRLSTVKLTTDASYPTEVHWLKHSVPPADREQKRYFGTDLQDSQKRSVQLEVFSAELLRVYIGLGQARTMISVDSAGVYCSLSEYIKKDSEKPHLSDDFLRPFAHFGRALWLSTLLDENDGHGGNFIVTPKPENCVVAIDKDRGFWSYTAIFDGSANEPKEVTIPAAKDAFFDDQYDPQECRLTRKEKDDPWERRYYLDKTEDNMGELTAEDYDNFPMTQHIMPKNTLFHSLNDDKLVLRFQQDEVFKNEQNFTQIKFLCGQLLDEAVAGTIFENAADKVEHYVLFDLRRKRIQQIHMLKESQIFKSFLTQYGNDVGYAIIFEFKCLCKRSPEFANNDYYSEQTLLCSIIGNYIALLEEMDVEVPSYLRNNLYDYQQSLRPDSLGEIQKSISYLQNKVLSFYQKTGMKLEELACQQYCQDLEARRAELQVIENTAHKNYIKASCLKKELERQQERINTMSVRIDFQLFNRNLDNLKGMLVDFNRPCQIDWSQYKERLAEIETYRGYVEVAADLVQVYQFAEIYSQNNETAVKGLIFKNLLPIIEGQIKKLMAGPSEEVVDNAKRTIEFCGFILSRHRYEKWQNFISLFGSRQRDNVAKGPVGFKEWQTGLDGTMESKVLKETFEETVRYNKKTAMIFGTNTHRNWASFHQACRPLLEKNCIDDSLIRTCSVACAA